MSVGLKQASENANIEFAPCYSIAVIAISEPRSDQRQMILLTLYSYLSTKQSKNHKSQIIGFHVWKGKLRILEVKPRLVWYGLNYLISCQML